MLSKEIEFHANRGWLAAIANRPKHHQMMNEIVLDRLLNLGYITRSGEYMIATDKGLKFLGYYIQAREEYEI